MKKYFPYIRKNWYCFLFGPLFMVLEACGEFFLPYINANIINIGAANGDIPYIVRNGVYMLCVAAAMLATGVLGANFAIRGAARLAAGVRGDVFGQVQRFSFADIDAFTTGSLITRLTNDMTQIQNFTQTLSRGMFRSPVMILGALAMSFVLNPRLAKILLVVVPLLAAAIAAIIKIASPRYTVMQRQLDLLNTDIAETVTSERVIKSFVREAHEEKKFGVINDSLVQKSTDALKWMLLLQPLSTLAVNVSTLLVVWTAGKQIMVGAMELGTLTAFITYLSQVLTALTFLANIVLQGTRAAASDRRIGEVLATLPSLTDENASRGERRVETGAVELRQVSFRYYKNNSERVLENINLSIAPGSFVGIIGATGSGKTTLVSLLPRLYDPDAGEVLVDGINVKELSLRHLREGVAMVLQKNTLFTGTIAQNLRWGDENATDAELHRAAELAEADAFIRAMPEGYETQLGAGGVNLSGGQKQRLCIARALLKKPKILILDDSTSAVDTATDARIRRALREELPGVTKIVIAQRIQSVLEADRIVVLDGGRLVGNGSHAQLLEACPEYRELAALQGVLNGGAVHG